MSLVKSKGEIFEIEFAVLDLNNFTVGNLLSSHSAIKVMVNSVYRFITDIDTCCPCMRLKETLHLNLGTS